MNFSKIVGYGIVGVFLTLGIASVVKKKKSEPVSQVQEKVIKPPVQAEVRLPREEVVQPQPVVKKEIEEKQLEPVDRIRQLFTKGSDKLPIVKTITYSSRVPWLVGRPAWIADYASHYKTSRHFIARSLNGKSDYFTQKVAPGDKFNILNDERDFYFYFVIDSNRCKMHLFYVDQTDNETVLLKSYVVGLGKEDPQSPSGLLTPTGKFKLGDRVASYKQGVMGYFQNQRQEMIQIFGTRWLPFEEEIGDCSDAARGYGMHGLPCFYNEEQDMLVEDKSMIGQYSSDGCIRLLKEDIEEVYSIVISRETIVDIKQDLNEWQPPKPFKYEEDRRVITQ